jgi:hypothetical protein
MNSDASTGHPTVPALSSQHAPFLKGVFSSKDTGTISSVFSTQSLVMSKPSVGFVGLGAMGFGMATHLVKQGYPVHGFDVFPASIERFKAAGGIPASSLRESAEDKKYYVVMVASAPQAQSVLFDDNGIVQCMYSKLFDPIEAQAHCI